MRRQAPRFAEQLAQADRRPPSLRARQPESDARDVADQSLDQCGERIAVVDSVVPDVNAGEHDLRMALGQCRRFIARVVGRCAGSRGAAGQRRRAERAVLVAAILDAQQRARARLHVRRANVPAARPSAAAIPSQIGAGDDIARPSGAPRSCHRRGRPRSPSRSSGGRRFARAACRTLRRSSASAAGGHGAAVEYRDVGLFERWRRSRRRPLSTIARTASLSYWLARHRTCADTPAASRHARRLRRCRERAADGRTHGRGYGRRCRRLPRALTQMRPPCASTTSRQNASPSPEPRTRGTLGVFTLLELVEDHLAILLRDAGPVVATMNRTPARIAPRAKILSSNAAPRVGQRVLSRLPNTRLRSFASPRKAGASRATSSVTRAPSCSSRAPSRS